MEDARFAVALTYEKLLRFAETIKAPFRKALGTGRIELHPPVEGGKSADAHSRASQSARAVLEGQTLVIPLYTAGRVVLLVVAQGLKPGQLSEEVHPFLSALAESALDMVRLRLALETDVVTGLANDYALDEILMSTLSRLMVTGRLAQTEPRELTLLAMEPVGLPTMLERYGRRFAQHFFKEIGRRLREMSLPCLCLAREDNSFLLLAEGGAEQAKEVARLVREGIAQFRPQGQGESWPVAWRMGVALAQPGRLNLPPAEAASLLRLRVRRALELARRLNLGQPLFFDEIVAKAGRVREVLSYNRLLLDLGRLHGLEEDTRFAVFAQEQDKAEIQVISLGEEDALAEVVNLFDPTFTLKAGDSLRLLPNSSPPALVKENKIKLNGQEFLVSLDEGSALISHHSFIGAFDALAAAAQESGQNLAVVLLRMDGLENLRRVVGRLRVERLFKILADKALAHCQPDIVLGRFAPDTLGAVLPDYSQEKASAWAQQLVEKLTPHSERSLRAGVGCYPCVGFAPQDILENAAKALVHAGFLEPGAVVACDAVSLNISGDSLFNQGRLSEAVAEYERALLLCDHEVNVLNSLGVCYGQLGKTEKAFAMFARAQAAAPNDYMAYYNQGYILLQDKQWEQAQEKLLHCLSLQPGHADTLFQLGRVAQEMGLLAEAMDYYQQAEASPQCPGGLFRYLGEVLALSGRLGEAEEAFKRASKYNSHDSVSLNHLAGLYLERGANLEIAFSLAKRALDLNPEVARHWQIYARAMLALQRDEEAALILEQGLLHHPEDPALLLKLAKIQINLGQGEKAGDNLQKVLRLEPNLHEALQLLHSLSPLPGA